MDEADHEHLAVLRLIRTAPHCCPEQLSVLAAQEEALAADDDSRRSRCCAQGSARRARRPDRARVPRGAGRMRA